MGQLLVQQGRVQEAAGALSSLGDLLKQRGRLEEAEEAYREVLRIDPKNLAALSSLGALFERWGRLEEAEKAYREVLGIKPEHFDALSSLLRIKPCDLAALFSLGALFERWGRPEEAEKAYREVLRIKPEHIAARLSLSRLLEQRGRPEEVPKTHRFETTRWELVLGSCQQQAGIEAKLDEFATILSCGDFPKEAVHRKVDVRAEPERSPVDCTVFAPGCVERGWTRLLQTFLHAPEARRRAEATARKFDPEAKERGHRSLVLDAPIGTTFSFDVEIGGFVFRERTDTLLWAGEPQAATFRFDVPKGCKLGQHAGTVRISQDGAPVGRITFQIEVVLDAHNASERPVGKEARHYHACFCSYSSLDRAEMLKRAQGLRATGLETFIDVLTLRSGDTWNPKIFEAINESDLFVLIWSTNARDSKWVKKESRYALRRYNRNGSPDFVPIPVEGPPIASVPRSLQAYYFNDELLGQIRAAELEMLARKHLGQSNVTPVTSES